MTTDELLFFEGWPRLLPVYAALTDALSARFPDVRAKVCKTQISLYNRRLFAAASLPVHRGAGWPREFLLVSFGLPYRLESPRIAAVSEPYPRRWTHHVCVASPEEIDAELLSWLDEAYHFAWAKR